jgi:NAD(P)H-dependent flavin oxidoreductase YrpB (nitropropane dioxygenase family)
MRVLCTRVVAAWAGREHAAPPPRPGTSIGRTTMGGAPYEMPRFSAILPSGETTGDFEQMCLAAGEGVSRIHDVRPAAKIVEEMMREAAQALRAAGR